MKKGIEKWQSKTGGLIAPTDIPIEKVMALKNYVVNDEILNAATGKNPKIKPGKQVVELMKERINWVETNYPNLMTKISKEDLTKIQAYIVNAWV